MVEQKKKLRLEDIQVESFVISSTTDVKGGTWGKVSAAICVDAVKEAIMFSWNHCSQDICDDSKACAGYSAAKC